ncbi:MAG: hypothetical protein HUJ31_12805 [Pseudomonadales bacterium]|nr:hypothetical protein [Pseudomonadales bacterium]
MIRAASRLAVLLLTGTFAWPPHASAESPSMHQYVTCAVYYRMLTASFSSRYGRGLDAMADINRERMDKAMALAREAGEAEYGEEAEDIFLEQWRQTLGAMTAEINHNYDNISRIKYKYKGRCEALIPVEE